MDPGILINGVDLIDPKKSHFLVDVSRDGSANQIGSVKSSDGILVLDRNTDGVVDTATEISFLSDAPNGRTSLQGLRSFDSNNDGVLSASDSSFAKFLIWRDINGNGTSDVGELQSLDQANVKSLILDVSRTQPDRGVGSTNDVLGVSKITFTDGSERAVYDAALGFADSKESDATPAAKPTASTSIGSSSLLSSSSADATVSASHTGPTLTASNIATGQSRGSNSAPENGIVEAASTATNNDDWWRDPSIVGQNYASLAASLGGQDSGLGANQSSIANGNGATDAATLQKLLLLRQGIASLPPASGGNAAIFTRGAANDGTTLAAAALRPVTSLPMQVGAGG